MLRPGRQRVPCGASSSHQASATPGPRVRGGEHAAAQRRRQARWSRRAPGVRDRPSARGRTIADVLAED